MKRKYTIAVAVFLGFCLCVIAFTIIKKEMRKMQLHAAYEALNTAVIIELDSYYSDIGRYPDSLDDLTEIEYSDGATPKLLEDFKYVSNGTSCQLSYFSAYFEKELIVHMIDGELKREDKCKYP